MNSVEIQPQFTRSNIEKFEENQMEIKKGILITFLISPTAY
jgi:hypothetical protein